MNNLISDHVIFLVSCKFTILQLDSVVKLHFATDAAELGIMEEIVEFPGILYAENVAEQDIL
jgi:hypothetical protein